MRWSSQAQDHLEIGREIRRLPECLDEAAEIGADMTAFCCGPAGGSGEMKESLAYYAEAIAVFHEKAAALDIR